MFLSCRKLFYRLSSLSCVFVCTYQTAALAVCTQESRFPFSPGWWEGPSSGAVDFCILDFKFIFIPVSLEMSHVVLLSSTVHKNRKAKHSGKSAWISMYTYTQSQNRQRSLGLIKFYLECAAEEENITTVSEYLGGAATLWWWWDNRNR